MSKNTPKSPKRYGGMSKVELRAATREYDAEMIDPPAAGVPEDVRARHDRAIAAARAAAEKRKRGRPVVGQGSTGVLISMEKGLLADVDDFAAEHGLTRSELVAEGLRLAMARGSATTGKRAVPTRKTTARDSRP